MRLSSKIELAGRGYRKMRGRCGIVSGKVVDGENDNGGIDPV